MNSFTSHDIDSAPAASRPLLEAAAKSLGFVPSLHAGMAESPAALKAYQELSVLFGRSALGPVEQQVVLLAVSVENACEFCVAAHSFVARHVAKAPAAVIAALRAGETLADARLDALAIFARRIVRARGWVNEGDVRAFLDAGFTRQQALDVVLGVSMKTLSNYANHLLKTPLDQAFAAERWEAPRKAA